ncbi:MULTISPECIES: phage tail protein [unclassified Pseudomonas]|uniref:phage tail protein n=1 Tax=unclassified Pseudomonas TaxID=196821 RepID=UPI000C86CA38|nr:MULTISPECIES: phage tail protein [unclassified Pseudomonas]PMV27273.1 phage tail protein [Pseudomonas sp. FW305-3-2-15-C-TSA2]PMV32528.1 phage tail protein [Pseudomonas sp. DP16D-L5]PMV42242.1 phage tail protein [Pseudomonas sp. FW305-3-2-15-A-LB2]PMV49718.1 phage tail protein [Pseudomonas sp. FW305-3-2-15-C-R2A1]PMV55166.1 phage tail protein [Pseudomonas sp. FW305-3-2-15-C-LB1]
MNKLRALTRDLVDCFLVPSEQFDSWAEQVTLSLNWKPTEQGLHLGDMRYRAVIVIARFADNPARLMALLGSWLETHDPHREDEALPAPVIEIEQLTPDVADIELQLDFIEPLHLAEAADGEIQAFNKRWAFVPYDLWVAEQGAVSHDRTDA